MTDAHCHPFDCMRGVHTPSLQGGVVDLLENMPREQSSQAEIERIKHGAACAANSWNREQFEYHEGLSKKAARSGLPPIIPCFGIHPQLPADAKLYAELKNELLDLLEKLPLEGRSGAIGETGFDLYDEKNRETEPVQDELFVLHLETAVKYGLPLVIHARRAMHKVFPFAKTLKKLPAVIFHSWPGTLGEGEALLRRGVNVFFSFGAAVVNNHREAMRCSAALPAERLLLETDAPYQPLRGRHFSSWEDLPVICRAIAALRKEAGNADNTTEKVEILTNSNFFNAFAGFCLNKREKQGKIAL